MALTTPYAKDSDLETYDAKVRSYGIDSYNDQLLLASEDVLNKIKGDWWAKATTSSLTSFDEDNLNTAQLLQYTVYRAFADYIFPKLSKFNGDIFQNKIDFYQKKADAEWAVIKELPLYDFDEDDVFEDDERRGPMNLRFTRG